MTVTADPALSPAAKLAYTLPEFRAAGGPSKTKCYELNKLGWLQLVRDAAGRTLVTADEARRYFANVTPLSPARSAGGRHRSIR